MDQARAITNILKERQKVKNVKRIRMRWLEGVVNNLRNECKVMEEMREWLSVINGAKFLIRTYS